MMESWPFICREGCDPARWQDGGSRDGLFEIRIPLAQVGEAL